MIVVDASVVVDALVADEHGSRTRSILARKELCAPDLIDAEVASALRGLWLSGALDDARLEQAVRDLRRLPLVRQPSMLLVSRAMQLRANLTSYDAIYVALAEVLDCPLLTHDRKMASAPGILCRVDVVD